MASRLEQVGIERLAIDTIRTLAIDAVEAAASGHPGTPMALAPVGYVLFCETLRYDPAWPNWPNRDRFVLSCGHASMLLYALLHLAEVRQLDEHGNPTGEPAVPLDHIRKFRQLGSRCPGHPEQHLTSGVETTTGPLGQGAGNSVGMAIASRWLAARYNRPDVELFDFDVYALVSDGDLMEGISGEAASLAGHLRLSNLCWIYDDNRITIEGETGLAFSEDVGRRFEAYGWHVLRVGDVNDLDALRAALARFKATDDRPTLIIVRSTIGFGAPTKAGSHEAHGAPLGAEEARRTKQAYGWGDQTFHVPGEVVEHFRDKLGRRGRQLYDDWAARLAQYQAKYPELAEQIERISTGQLPDGWDADLPVFPADPKGTASRNSSGKALNAVAKRIPWLVGGSADLAPSNKSDLTFDEAGHFQAGQYAGRNFHFGIREHAMAAICNGMALCGLRPYGATFFVFTDYMRPSMRLAALMGLPVLYLLTHDSIGVGEDGPTHQPVEHLAALRAIPNLVVLRPADANEVSQAYRAALSLKHQPAALVLTRQNLPTLDRTKYAAASGAARGAYVLSEPPGEKPRAILMASGSEVALCLDAQSRLQQEGIPTRVVSMVSWELFDAQPSDYRDAVLPPEVSARVAVEAGVAQGWERYLGSRGRFIGLSGFGASAPYEVLYRHFGLTVENIVAAVRALCAENG